ncbi:hypothetical protein [Roseinatronobacter sp. NSM]|uniref:hypothetical protein n=1 Tax=Roseinatronobacter sp. NSM TaxID=3457785 RepID=UPI0040368AE9
MQAYLAVVAIFIPRWFLTFPVVLTVLWRSAKNIHAIRRHPAHPRIKIPAETNIPLASRAVAQ